LPDAAVRVRNRRHPRGQVVIGVIDTAAQRVGLLNESGIVVVLEL
jgi:hypothetical protein